MDLTFETVVTNKEPPILNAQCAILIETSTGRILYEKNAYTPFAMASTTKIMTALVVLEHVNLEEVVTVSKHAANTQGSTIHLQTGEQISVKDLLYGLMLSSGNDAAVALAEHVAGNEEDFLKLMNEKAVGLGLTKTHFSTVHGLDAPQHHSTAYDMAHLASVCMENDIFREIVSTTQTHISQRTLRNTNDLLFTYAGATGIKTGYTEQAGRCLVSSAKRENMEVIAVVLGCESKTTRFSDSRKLLDYAFEQYDMTTILESGEEVMQMEVKKGVESLVPLLCTDTICLPLTAQEKETYQLHIMANPIQEAPCLRGEEVGTIYISQGEQTIAFCTIMIGKTIERKDFFGFLRIVMNSFWRVF